MPKPLHANPLVTATTQDLITELKRRSLGCMLVCVRAEERGDRWHYALKGSTLMLGALSAAISLHTQQHLADHDHGDATPV